MPSGRSLLYIWLSPLDRYSGPAKLDDSCGDGSDDTRRSKSGARRTTVMVALVGEDERAVLWQKLLTRASFSPTIRPRSSADTCKRAWSRPDLPDASVARYELRSVSHSAYSFMALIAVEWLSTQMSLKSYSGVPVFGMRPPSGVLRALPRWVPYEDQHRLAQS